MKFLIDADCPRSLGEVPLQLGHEVQDIRDLRPNADDEEIYEIIKKESLILITRDTDFSNIFRFPLTPSSGIILLRTLLLSPPALRALLQVVFNTIPLENFLGSLVVVRPGGRWRIHRF